MLQNCLQATLLVAGLAGASGPGCFVPDPALAPPRPITIALGETVKSFMGANRLASGASNESGAYAIDIDRIGDTQPILFADNWIRFTFADGEEGFSLPPGRTLMVSQLAGRITQIVFTPGAEPQSLEALSAYASKLYGALQDLGWSGEVAVFLPKSATDFDERTHIAMVAQLHGQNGHDVELIARQVGFADDRQSRLLTVAARKDPPPRAPGYLLDLRFTQLAANNPHAADTLLPRRILVNGTAERPLKLRAWAEQPDWNPVAAGMVPASPDEVRRDGSAWVRPPVLKK